MSIYHNHHIIPKHAGGTDHPSNIIRLTVEDHALAHLKLYQKNGKLEDLWAYKTISQRKDIDISGKNNHMYGKKGENNPNWGRKHSEETKKKMSMVKSGKNHPLWGKKVSEETKRKMSLSQIGKKGHMWGKKLLEETKRKISEKAKERYMNKQYKG